MGPFLERIRNDDIAMVAAWAFEVVEEKALNSSRKMCEP
jgi:hypothetical protein